MEPTEDGPSPISPMRTGVPSFPTQVVNHYFQPLDLRQSGLEADLGSCAPCDLVMHNINKDLLVTDDPSLHLIEDPVV